VLLVEDDEVDVLNVRRAFSKKNFQQELQLADDGLSALEHLDKHELPDIILLDLNMPRMGGLEFLKEFNQQGYANKNIDVFVMSTSSEEQDINEAKALGAKGYIVKPLFTNEFADELAHILG